MNRNLWEDLVTQNPMLIEIHRFRRRYLSFSGHNGMNSAILALTMICYAGLVLVVMSGKGNIPPDTIVMVQTGLFTFFAPGMLHGAIAGERERRSWDLLLVAPVTKTQIVFGKFIGALMALTMGAAFFAIPTFIAAVMWSHTNWSNLILCEVVSLTFAVAVCALTILISARVRRPFMALGATLGSLAAVLVIFPVLLGLMLAGAGPYFGDVVLYLHPFYVLSQIHQVDTYVWAPERNMNLPQWGWPQSFVYLALAAILVGWAANTLNFAENDVKFIPRGNKDA